jgi:hypothetical protein
MNHEEVVMRSVAVTTVVLLVIAVCTASLRAGLPAAQPFTLEYQIVNPAPATATTMPGVLLGSIQSFDIRPRININPRTIVSPSPADSIERWSGVIGGFVRPALLHITPNVVQTPSGNYVLHQDTVRQLPIYLQPSTLRPGPYRAGLIDDRGGRQK